MKIDWRYEIKENEKITPDQLISLIIKHRKIKDINTFLNSPHPLSISLTDFDPRYKLQLIKVINLLKEIKEKKQMIVVYTDYDADGITGGAILWETLYLLGFNTMPYVPHRKLEGYGFSIKGIDNVKKKFNPRLIISVDHGITAKEKIAYAKKLEMKVIVTDHHLKPEKLPCDAEAIFHIPELSGAGVSYFFSKMIFDYFNANHRQSIPTSNFSLLTSNFSLDYLALASIGTIADLVPLVGPSRSLVKYGLEAFTKVKRQGLKHILKEAGIEGKKITPYEVGFIIAPRINAVGRLEHAIDALRLLCTTDEKRAHNLACKVGNKNIERQKLVEKSVEEARKKLQDTNHKLQKVIILTSNHWHEGIIGLIASKIAEEYYRPTIVMTQSDGYLKGSARSIPSFHITNFLRSMKKYLIDVGGHKQAAGFSMEKKNLDAFCSIVQETSQKLINDQDLERKIEVDLKIPISKINLSLTKSLEKLAPFGIGNPTPTFYSQVEIADIKTFGKNNDHFKIWVKDQRSTIDNRQSLLELISFFKASEYKNFAKGQKIDLIFTLEIDRFTGVEKVRGKICQILRENS